MAAVVISKIGWFEFYQRWPGLGALVGAMTGLTFMGVGIFLVLKPLMAFTMRREFGGNPVLVSDEHGLSLQSSGTRRDLIAWEDLSAIRRSRLGADMLELYDREGKIRTTLYLDPRRYGDPAAVSAIFAELERRVPLLEADPGRRFWRTMALIYGGGWRCLGGGPVGIGCFRRCADRLVAVLRGPVGRVGRGGDDVVPTIIGRGTDPT